MTEDKTSGAASDDQIDWDAIDWQNVEKEVTRLQARILIPKSNVKMRPLGAE